MAASDATTISLPEDTIDDLIYLARTGNLSELQNEITALTSTHPCPASTILTSAIDLSSGNTLLHYPAANGNADITRYLLTLLPPSTAGTPTALAAAIMNRKNNGGGNTALHWAALNGHLDVVKALVEAGADPGVMNAAGRDAIVEAEMSGKDGADACGVWMLEHWAGAEKGIGGEGDVNGEGAVNGDGEKAA